jgi:2-methylaconitate isomerase
LKRSDVPGVGPIEVTMINAGNPHVLVRPEVLGVEGSEMQAELNQNEAFLERCELIRSHCTVLMGLAKTAKEATKFRPHTPKIAFVSPPKTYTSSSGKKISADQMDMTARILSMGKVHHAMTGTGGVGLTVAASIEGTVVQQVAGDAALGGRMLRIGHPSGIMAVAATTHKGADGQWQVEKVTMNRCARRLMEGWVLV